MSLADSADFDDNVIAAIIRELGNYTPLLRGCRPVAWDSDARAVLPNLRVKVTSEPLIPSQPVYAAKVVITFNGKPKRGTLRALKRDVQDFCEDTELGDMLTDSYINIATNAEDVSSGSEVVGDTREYKRQFTLRGFRLQ